MAVPNFQFQNFPISITMSTEILGVLLVYGLVILLAIPFGKYIARVFAGERTWLDPVFNPLERAFFKISGIDPSLEMTWKQHLRALLTINFIWFLLGMFILMNQGWLPFNPDGNPSMSAHLAFNTVISFVINCNLQHYAGETGLSYLGQIFAVQFFQFVSAATGIAACAAVYNAMRERTATYFGNFYHLFLKSCTRILLPVAFVASIILAFSGTPQTFKGKDTMITMQGDTVQVSRGPVAGMVAIKQAGTNGGGWYGVNSAHPLENPDYLTNAVENILILLIPMALVFALGYYLNRRKLAWTIFGVMTAGFLLLLTTSVYFETQASPVATQLGIDGSAGNMEGKEVRLGAAASALWGISTTATSNGSVNSMHDSHTPISGAMQLLDMMINSLYGGVGVGFLNFYIFIILAVFISGLMVGRTPEFLGKKVEGREMKIALVIALLHPFIILVGTALSAFIFYQNPEIGWLNNPGFHGFSEMLYENTSAAANNGSGFEGLADNNPWWNILTGFVLILGRYLPIIGPVAIAGLLANKKYIPESAGMLKTDTFTFGMMVFAVIFIVAALAFFPALALGPLAEYFSL